VTAGATVQLLAVLMGAAHAAVWLLGSRWERPGRTARLRARLPLPSLPVRGGYVALAVPLLYPALVVIAPRWGYEGSLNWSSRIDVVLQGAGVGLWFAGVVVLLWAAGPWATTWARLPRGLTRGTAATAS
jgi:hypothetical protein